MDAVDSGSLCVYHQYVSVNLFFFSFLLVGGGRDVEGVKLLLITPFACYLVDSGHQGV